LYNVAMYTVIDRHIDILTPPPLLIINMMLFLHVFVTFFFFFSHMLPILANWITPIWVTCRLEKLTWFFRSFSFLFFIFQIYKYHCIFVLHKPYFRFLFFFSFFFKLFSLSSFSLFKKEETNKWNIYLISRPPYPA
jgi:hypothetical protein